MMSKLFLLLLPTLVSTNINIQMNVSEDLKDVILEAFGEHTDIISEDERAAFRIKDEDLKQAFEKLDNPRRLTFLTWPWDNMDFSNIMIKLRPNFSVVGIRNHPVVMRKHIDNTRHIANHWSDMVNSIYTSFSSKSDLTDKNVTYTVNFLGSNRFNISGKWGEPTIYKSPDLSLALPVALKLLHHQERSLDMVLRATKKTIEVEVDFELTLSGKLVCKGQLCPNERNYLAATNINFIMAAIGRPIKIRSKETMFIEFYTDVYTDSQPDAHGQPIV